MNEAENRVRKARAIARALWRRGMTVDDLRGLPYSSRTRQLPTMCGFARAAYVEAGVLEAVPSSETSETWTVTASLLEQMTWWVREHPGDARNPPQDLTHEADRWRGPRLCLDCREPIHPLALRDVHGVLADRCPGCEAVQCDLHNAALRLTAAGTQHPPLLDPRSARHLKVASNG